MISQFNLFRSHDMKVLFLASWYPNEDNNYSGIFIKRHAEAVSKYCDVCVLYVHMSQHRNKISVESTTENGVKTIRVYSPSAKKDGVIGALKYYYSCLRGLKTVHKEFGRPDIIHAHVIRQAGILALLVNRLTGIPYVLSEHSTQFSNYYSSKFYTNLCNEILYRASVIMPVSYSLENQMRRHYSANKYQIVPNVVDTKRYIPLIKSKRQVKRILHVSMLNDYQKNVSGIITAIKELSSSRDDFELHIVGDGPDRAMLEELAGYLLNSKIFFHGRVDDPTLTSMMQNADFFVLNSRCETFSIVCAEALSAGIPVISTVCGGPEEFVNKDCGVLIQPGELVSTIDFMLDNYEKYDPVKLHKRIENKFSPCVVGNLLYNEYMWAI